jgi:hypothetical protein
MQLDTWHGAALAGSATNDLWIDDALVPASRTTPVQQMMDSIYPQRRLNATPHFNRPFIIFISLIGGSGVLSMARGAMDAFMEALPTRDQSLSPAGPQPLRHQYCIISSPGRSSISRLPKLVPRKASKAVARRLGAQHVNRRTRAEPCMVR